MPCSLKSRQFADGEEWIHRHRHAPMNRPIFGRQAAKVLHRLVSKSLQVTWHRDPGLQEDRDSFVAAATPFCSVDGEFVFEKVGQRRFDLGRESLPTEGSPFGRAKSTARWVNPICILRFMRFFSRFGPTARLPLRCTRRHARLFSGRPLQRQLAVVQEAAGSPGATLPGPFYRVRERCLHLIPECLVGIHADPLAALIGNGAFTRTTAANRLDVAMIGSQGHGEALVRGDVRAAFRGRPVHPTGEPAGAFRLSLVPSRA